MCLQSFEERCHFIFRGVSQYRLTPMKMKWHLSSKLWRHITQLDGAATEKTRFLNKQSVGTSAHRLRIINNIFLSHYFIFLNHCFFLYPATRRNKSEDLLPQYEIIFATNKIVSSLWHLQWVKRQLYPLYRHIFNAVSLSPPLSLSISCWLHKWQD